MIAQASTSAPKLVTLQVTLTFWEGFSHVEMQLAHFNDPTDENARTWRVPANEIGVPETLTADIEPRLTLPPQVVEGLRAGLVQMRLGDDEVVWLRLVRPYGYLGVLPWEGVLGVELRRPVLRLPDFTEQSRENTEVLAVAVCFDLAPQTLEARAIDQIGQLVDSILKGSTRRQTRVDVFTTAAWFERVRAIWSFWLDGRVRVHNPAEAEPRALAADQQGGTDHVTSGQRITAKMSPWLEWICKALHGRSLDVVHFVSMADVSDGRGYLMLSSSPAGGS
jgi:hypothetical protein